MPITWTDTMTTSRVISGTSVQAQLTKVDNTISSLAVHDPVKGGSILLQTAAQITELKQWLIDAGY